jgi:hypothetical protein
MESVRRTVRHAEPFAYLHFIAWLHHPPPSYGNDFTETRLITSSLHTLSLDVVELLLSSELPSGR